MRDTQSLYNFTVRWLPFQLRPNFPPEGFEKAPDTPGNRRVGDRLKTAGSLVGIDFTGRTDRYPNTLLAHTLLSHTLETKGAKVQDHLSEVLFRHYFTDGLYPDVENLVKAAEEVGMDEQSARRALGDLDLQARAQAEARASSQNGVSGVPYFFINGKPAFSGAQDPQAFKEAFGQFK